MYQMSKNLNRPFFIEVLTEISVKYAKDGLEAKEDDEEDTGDNILTMLLKPSYTTQDSSKTQHDENFFHEDEGGSQHEEDEEEDQYHSRKYLRSPDFDNRKISLLKKDLVRIKSSPIPNGNPGYHHEEKVWEIKDSLRKKIRREQNTNHSPRPSRRPSLRKTSGTNIAEIGLDFLTDKYFINKV